MCGGDGGLALHHRHLERRGERGEGERRGRREEREGKEGGKRRRGKREEREVGKWEGKGVSKIVCITLQMYTVNIKGRRGYKIVYACEGYT